MQGTWENMDGVVALQGTPITVTAQAVGPLDLQRNKWMERRAVPSTQSSEHPDLHPQRHPGSRVSKQEGIVPTLQLRPELCFITRTISYSPVRIPSNFYYKPINSSNKPTQELKATKYCIRAVAFTN